MAWFDPIVGAVIGLVVLGAIFVPLERKWPLVPRRLLRPQWRTDVAHFAFTGILDAGFAIVGIVAAFLLVGWWTPAPLAFLNAAPVLVTFPIALLLGNLLGYWSHRLSHTVPLLWRFHKIHHSSVHLDWLAAGRRHPLEQTWAGLFIGVPLIFLGFAPAEVGAVQIFNLLWGIFLHSNVRIRIPGVRHVIATPEFHHWHHSADPEHYNTNYSLFPWLDGIFGTRYMPEERSTEFGVRGYEPPGYVGQLMAPFRRRWRKRADGLEQGGPYKPTYRT